MNSRPPQEQGPSSGCPSPSPGALPPQRRWWFRLIALTVVPLLLLGAGEAGLRVARYGYDTNFFLPCLVHGKEMLIENDQFALRFFPPRLARTPEPLLMPALKPAGTSPRLYPRRIGCAGRSGTGLWRRALLAGSSPREISLGEIRGRERGDDGDKLPCHPADCTRVRTPSRGPLDHLHGQQRNGRALWRSNGFGVQTPPLPVIRLSLALQTTRLGQFLTALARKLRPNPAAPSSWGGMEMFLRNKLPPRARTSGPPITTSSRTCGTSSRLGSIPEPKSSSAR